MGLKPKDIKSQMKSKSPAVIVKTKETMTPVSAPVLTPAQQALQEQDAVDFGSLGKDMSEGTRLLNQNGFNQKNSGQSGSGSNNMYQLTENVGSDLSKVPAGDKAIHGMSQRALIIAKKKGIKNGAEFLDRAEEIMKEAGGKDYEIMKNNNMIPNLDVSLSRIYENKNNTYVPAEKRYTFNATTGQLSPNQPSPTAMNTPAQTANIAEKVQEARTQPGKSIKLTVKKSD
jgi:hypothetical protein